MQQVYCRTFKQKCDFNKVALQLYFSQFFKNTLRWLLLGWEKSKLAQVTQLVLVSIMLLLYTLSEEGNVQLISMYGAFFSLHFYLLSYNRRIHLLIVPENHLVWCFFETEWYFQRSFLGLFCFICFSIFRCKCPQELIEITGSMMNCKTI